MSSTDKPEATPSDTPDEKFPRRPHREGKPPDVSKEDLFGSHGRMRDLDDQIEQELQEALGGLSDKELYGEPQQRRKPASGSEGTPGRLKGRVFRVHGADVFMDLPGGRSQGMLQMTQFPEGPPEIGTEVEVSIEGYDRANGLLVLSRKGAAMTADWSTVAVGMTVEARVTAVNKGGLSVEINGIRGFMPISQIDLYRTDNAEQFVNQRLLCEVVEVNPEERNLVVSRRALLEREREEAREKFWQEVAEGQVREGVVRSVREFGAFVDLGGADGLLHVSEMSWTRVQDPSTIVQTGQRLKVVVLKIDRDKRKIGLGLKQLGANPWDDIGTRFWPSLRVKGRVVKLMDFGAFVELEPGVEGLIHISELSPQRIRRVGDVVQEGQDVEVVVLNVDPANRRISLSLKAALVQSEPEEETPEGEEGVEEAPRPRNRPLRGGIGEKTWLPGDEPPAEQGEQS